MTDFPREKPVPIVNRPVKYTPKRNKMPLTKVSSPVKGTLPNQSKSMK